MIVEVLERQCTHGRPINFAGLVAIPIVLADRERRMRAGEGYDLEKRLVFRFTRAVIEALDRAMFDLVVVVFLHGAHAGTGFDHTIQRGARGHKGRTRLPIRDPLKTGGINIRHRALIEPVFLIGANKMHLAAQFRPIPSMAQIMRHCRHRAGQFICVIKDIDVGRQHPAEH